MPNRRATRAWPDVVSFYREFAKDNHRQFQPMLALVQYLAGSRYASSLFPFTSHETLLLGRVVDFEAGDAELQIHFDGAKQQFKFTYIQRPDDVNPWSRECDASEWQHALERVLHKRLQWFHEG